MNEQDFRKQQHKAQDEAERLRKDADDLLRVEGEDVDALYREATNHPDQMQYWKDKASERQDEINRLADDMRRKADQYQHEADKYAQQADQAHREHEKHVDQAKELGKRFLGF